MTDKELREQSKSFMSGKQIELRKQLDRINEVKKNLEKTKKLFLFFFKKCK